MCGFVGYVDQKDVPKGTIENMANRIKHRGPDDEAYFNDGKVSMGFRRLSIIDLAHGGQPLFSQDHTKVLTYNGEIYNYKEIRKELQKLGYTFQTDVDSEVIIRGYEAWGAEILKKLRGMFAFVIYDSTKKQVLAARDHFGIKPLYYYYDGKTFLWGSEIKTFLEHPNFKKEFNTKLLPIHLSFQFIPSDKTLFKHVYKVMPSQYVIYHIDSNRLEKHEYYHFNYNHIDNQMTTKDAVNKIHQLVSDTVKAHMVSDVPVGSFLSSGVDSSYILNEAAKHTPIHSFSLGYKDSKYSELKYSTKFANRIHQKNTQIYMNADDYFKIVPTIMYYMDEPLSNAAENQAFYLSRDTRKDVKVALSGEGIDEFFGGYVTYMDYQSFEKYKKMVPKFIRVGLSKLAAKLPRFHGRRFLIRGGQPLWENYYRVNYIFNNAERNKLLKHPSMNVDSGKYTKHIFDQVNDKDPVTQEQYFDIKTWLPFDILHQADRMSMCNSLEVRTPFVDKEIANFAMTVPARLRIKNGVTKYIWRKAANSQVPMAANRPKLGFPSPLASWMRLPKYHQMIMKVFHSDVAHRFFNVKYLDKLVKQHDNGKSNMQKIYTIYCFIIWYEIYFPENTNINMIKHVHLTKNDR
ncbi:MAG: asparagine synthase (glutamine-hydrolyzing) [Acetilactobacillus jinshanensis]